MPKIKNMGHATAKFNEGLIVNGDACGPGGSASGYAMIVTGSAVFDTRDGGSGDSGGITVIKDEQDPVFVRFINDDDPTSWYAYIAMDSAENFYISPGRSQDFYIITRENSGANYYYPFRIFDNGKIKFHQAAQSSSDAQSELPADVVFSVSGSLSGTEGISLFTGNVVVSGTLDVRSDKLLAQGRIGIGTDVPASHLTINGTEPTILFQENGADSATIGVNSSDNILIENKVMNKHIVFKVNDQGVVKEGFRLDGAVPEVVVNQTSDSLVDFRVESDNNTHMLFVDGSQDKIGIGLNNPSHMLDINGDIRVRGNDIRDNSGNPAVSFDGSANTTIVNNLTVQDYTFPASDGSADQVLQTNGNGQLSFVNVSGGGGGAGLEYAVGHVDLTTNNKPVNWVNASSISASSGIKSWFIVPKATTIDKVIVSVKGNNFSTANDGNVTLSIYKNQQDYGSTIVNQTVGADDFTEKVSNMAGGTTDCNQKIFSGLNQSVAEGDLIHMKVGKSAGSDKEALVTVVFSSGGSSSSGLSLTAQKNSNYTAANGEMVLVDLVSASGDVTVTLPAASADAQVVIKIAGAAMGKEVIVDGNSSETVDGLTTRVMNTDYESMHLISDGNNWWRIS